MKAKKNQQLLQAETLGMIANQQGAKRVPHLDAQVCEMFNTRKIGETPKGEATTTSIMKAWLLGWDKANIAA